MECLSIDWLDGPEKFKLCAAYEFVVWLVRQTAFFIWTAFSIKLSFLSLVVCAFVFNFVLNASSAWPSVITLFRCFVAGSARISDLLSFGFGDHGVVDGDIW